MNAINLSESMVSNFREFNNCGCFMITIDGTTYSVKYSNTDKTIKTDAPSHIKEAIQAWWFV